MYITIDESFEKKYGFIFEEWYSLTRNVVFLNEDVEIQVCNQFLERKFKWQTNLPQK